MPSTMPRRPCASSARKRRRYRIDPARIAIAGTSAGAITALHVGANADDPGDSGNPGYSSAVGAAVSLSGAKLLGSESEGDAPLLMFHGTVDDQVPYDWAVNTLDEAQAAGLVSYLTTYQGEGHVPFNARRPDHRPDDELPVLDVRPRRGARLTAAVTAAIAGALADTRASGGPGNPGPPDRGASSGAQPPLRSLKLPRLPFRSMTSPSSTNVPSCVGSVIWYTTIRPPSLR